LIIPFINAAIFWVRREAANNLRMLCASANAEQADSPEQESANYKIWSVALAIIVELY